MSKSNEGHPHRLSRRDWLATVVRGGAVAAIGSAACDAKIDLGAEPKAVSGARSRVLGRGLNICLWFRYPRENSAAHFRDYLSDADMRLIRELGFEHVRLVLAPDLLLDSTRPGKLNATLIGHVDQAIRRLLDHDLKVLVDFHAEYQQPGKDIETQLLKNDQGVAQAMRVLEQLARLVKPRDANRVVFELMNEPVFLKQPAAWNRLIKQLHGAVRSVLPDHTLMLGGSVWSSIYGLTLLEPVADRNVLYTFHFYEPYPFTHQGAEWGDPAIKELRELPYPVDRERCASLGKQLTVPAAQAKLAEYCGEGWNLAKLEARFQEAARWGERHQATLYVGEFGVYGKQTLPADRLRWFRDMRSLLDKYRFEWALWGYDESFGLGARRSETGKIEYDRDVVEALGLKPAQ